MQIFRFQKGDRPKIKLPCKDSTIPQQVGFVTEDRGILQVSRKKAIKDRLVDEKDVPERSVSSEDYINKSSGVLGQAQAALDNMTPEEWAGLIGESTPISWRK